MALRFDTALGRLRTWVDRTRRIPLVSAFLVIFSGNVLAQLILLISIPVLSRLYEPEAFGSLASLMSIVGIVGTISSLAVERAIPLAHYKWQTTALGLIGLSAVILCAIVAELAIMANPAVIDALGPGISYLPEAVLLVGGAQVLQAYLIREKEYRSISYAKIIQNLSMTSFQVAAPIASIGATGLFAGYIFGCLASISFVSRKVYILRNRIFRNLRILSIKSVINRYGRLLFVQTPSNFITSIGWSLPPIIIAMLYDTKVAGIYFMAERIAIMPTVMIGQAIAPVFFGESARMAPAELYRRSISTQRVLFVIGVLISSGIIAFSLFFTKLVLGDQWGGLENALVYTSLIVPFMLSIYPVAQFSMIARQGLHFFWSIFRVVIVVSSVSAPYILRLPGEYSIAFFSIATILSYIIMHILWHFALVAAKNNSR